MIKQLVEVPYEMLQISKLYAFQFQRRRILKFSFSVPVFKLVNPLQGQGKFWANGHHMNKLVEVHLEMVHAILISKLYAFKFQRERSLMMGLFVPMFQLVTPGVGPVLTPGASYE